MIVLLFVRSRVGKSMGVEVEDVELLEATDFVKLSMKVQKHALVYSRRAEIAVH